MNSADTLLPCMGPEKLEPEIEVNIKQISPTTSEKDIAAFKRVILQEEAEDILSSGKPKQRVKTHSKTTRYIDGLPEVRVWKTYQLMIGDSEEVEKFYAARFKDIQQSNCKRIAKAFVKLVEPKKVTHYPYARGDGNRAPPWWPKTTGEDGVRHREPDHLLKPGYCPERG